jgi:glutamate---cysteine ligase / carboxylate-amine ligase
MESCQFTPSGPTVGVEIELQLVDLQSLNLVNRCPEILAALPAMKGIVKAEFLQNCLEINSNKFETVREVGDDLRSKLEDVERITKKLGIGLHWAGTHPFAQVCNQHITQSERYVRLNENMQYVARQLVTFGLHVHVGVESGDKAIMICDRMMRHLPLLLALSANSPFYEGEDTGLCSIRSKKIDQLPTAGTPLRIRNWSEYNWLLKTMQETGFVETPREIWWDVRPHHDFGTVEVRICDMPPNLNHVLSLAALIHCLVVAIGEKVDEGVYYVDSHPLIVRINKWNAARYGSRAILVDADDQHHKSVPNALQRLLDVYLVGKGQSRPNGRPWFGESLKCLKELHGLADVLQHNGAEEQLEVYQQANDLSMVVRELLDRHDWKRLPEIKVNPRGISVKNLRSADRTPPTSNR